MAAITHDGCRAGDAWRACLPAFLLICFIAPGYKPDPVVYANTRRFILRQAPALPTLPPFEPCLTLCTCLLASAANPHYHTSAANSIAGIGSEHTAKAIPNGVWHMGLIMQVEQGLGLSLHRHA